jgi:hypothetical protein
VTPTGELCSDFEHVTLGPVEWDLASIGPDSRAVYDAAATQLGLRSLDERLLQVMLAYQSGLMNPHHMSHDQ